MSQIAWGTAAWAAAMGGFAALGLAMDRHHEDVYGRGRSPGRARPLLQAAGTAGLLLALACSLAAMGRSQGWVLWFGELTAGALAIIALLSYAPRHAPRFAVACPLVALSAGFAAGFT